MPRIKINIEADIVMDEDVFDDFRKLEPPETEEFLDNALRSEQGITIQGYDLTYEITRG